MDSNREGKWHSPPWNVIQLTDPRYHDNWLRNFLIASSWNGKNTAKLSKLKSNRSIAQSRGKHETQALQGTHES
jgi:hypothetical protein